MRTASLRVLLTRSSVLMTTIRPHPNRGTLIAPAAGYYAVEERPIFDLLALVALAVDVEHRVEVEPLARGQVVDVPVIQLLPLDSLRCVELDLRLHKILRL
eukprot:8825617-Pyramimonas_sp.AAC.1